MKYPLQFFMMSLLFAALLETAAGDTLSVPGGNFATKQLGPVAFLPVDEAFVLTVSRGAGEIQLHWQVKPGYYLYKDRLGFSGQHIDARPTLPHGIEKYDEIFGDVEVYYSELLVELPVLPEMSEDNGKITVEYQGCADAGLCYPPQNRVFLLKDI